MFEPPTSLSENVQQFLELSEAQKIVADLNRILHKTAFNPKLTNPCFLLALLFYFMFLGIVLPLLMRFSLNEEEPSTGLYYICFKEGAAHPKIGKELLEWNGKEWCLPRNRNKPPSPSDGEPIKKGSDSALIEERIGGILFFAILICFFILVHYFKTLRRRQLTNYIAELNRCLFQVFSTKTPPKGSPKNISI